MTTEMLPPARYDVGRPVRVARREEAGHCRTPWYLRGRSGVIVARLGTYRDPVKLAYHRPGLPARPLYKVRFRQSEVWAGYVGDAGDHLEADIYEHWLEPLDGSPDDARA